MPFQPVTNGFKTAIEGRQNGEPAVITQGWLTNGLITPLEVQLLATGVADWFTGNLLPLLSPDYVYEQTVATGLRTESDLTFTSDTASGTAGGAIVASDPNNVTLAVSFRSGVTGRSFRGRNYVPGLPGSAISNNRVSATLANNIAGAYEILMGTDAVATGFTWGVISRRTNNAPRVAGIVTPITQVVIVDTVVDSQRRRLPGRGA